MPASIWRRFFAAFYDFLILIAVLMLAGFIWLFASKFNAESMSTGYYKLYLLAVTTAFYVYFWVKGQTLGMLAWSIRVCRTDGRNLGWLQALWRFACSLLIFPTCGMTYATALLDQNRRAMHDILSRTVVISTKSPSTE